MRGTVVWWSNRNSQGVASVTENGVNTRYFLLQSRILSAPDDIRPGDHVKFESFLKPKGTGLLPLAIGVIISRTPFVDAGANALAKAGAQ
jgi:hypothetical protein